MSREFIKINSNDEMGKLINDTFTNIFKPGYVLIGDEKLCMPAPYEDIAEDIENFEVYDDDIWVISHPKCGTTWTQEMVWLLANDLNFEATRTPLAVRFPFLEIKCIYEYSKVLKINPDFEPPRGITESINTVKNFKRPRFIKTHLAWNLLPKQLREKTKTPKIIYVVRNPKDTCTSYFHHSQVLEGYNGDFNQFCELFLDGKLTFGPFWVHILNYWERRSEPNILFLKFEDMKRDLPSVLKQTADFLGKQLPEDQIKALTHHLSFETMSKKEGVSYAVSKDVHAPYWKNNVTGKFFRSGKVGSYKEEMSAEMMQKFDKWTEENSKGTGLTF